MVRGSFTGFARVGYPAEKYSQYLAVALHKRLLKKNLRWSEELLTLYRQSDTQSN